LRAGTPACTSPEVCGRPERFARNYEQVPARRNAPM
jgi:hypothetical protein